jgi:transposase
MWWTGDFIGFHTKRYSLGHETLLTRPSGPNHPGARGWDRDATGDGRALLCQWLVCRATLAAVAQQRQQGGEAPRGRPAGRPPRPLGVTADRGRQATRCHTRRIARPQRGGPGATRQRGDHLPRLTAPAPPAQQKSLHASERDTERVQTLRAAFRAPVQALDGDRLQLVDEAGTTLAMIRRYGRATPGHRVVDHVPDNYGTNQTIIAALGLDGLDAPWVVDGAINGAIFHCWVREVLGPTLQPGAIVLWDHLSAHKVAGVEELLATRGARLLRLSPYSPDFKPIEQCWSKIKTGLRRAKARTVEALIEAIKEALDTSTPADIRGWFVHCGYSIQ